MGVSHRQSASFLLFVFFAYLQVFAQIGGQAGIGGVGTRVASPNVSDTPTRTGTAVEILVKDGKHNLDRQAVVQVTNKATNAVHTQVTQEDSTARVVELPAGIYELQVSAVGFLTSKQEIILSGRTEVRNIEVPLEKDSGAVDLGAVKTREVSPKVRKDMLQAVGALESGKLEKAQKKLDAAYSHDPANPDIEFLLGYLNFQKNDFQKARAYLLDATKKAPHNAEAQTLLGRVDVQLKDYSSAQKPLEQAIAVNPGAWMAHYLLSTVYLEQDQYEKAKDQAQFAIERGADRAFPAQLIKGQALANLKQYHQALDALHEFVKAAPSDPSVPQVKSLIADVEKRSAELPASSNQAMSAVVINEPIVAATQPNIALKAWGPQPIDATKPQIAANVSCPADKIMEQAGERVKNLVDDLSKFDAIEDVYHEDVDQLGIPKTQVNLRFDYVASIAEPKPGEFLVDEYRSGRSGTEDFPDHIATRGLPTLALVFHPDMRENFDMNCEGLSSWNEKATWLVRFQQREDKPHRVQEYIINGHAYPVSMRGRAWISADTYQIIRLEAELVNPMPEIQLLSEHQTVDYAPVSFAKSKTELWLPKNAEIYFDLRKHRYYRRHSFDHFMLFSVDVDEKRKEPVAQQKKPESRTPTSKHKKVHA